MLLDCLLQLTGCKSDLFFSNVTSTWIWRITLWRFFVFSFFFCIWFFCVYSLWVLVCYKNNLHFGSSLVWRAVHCKFRILFFFYANNLDSGWCPTPPPPKKKQPWKQPVPYSPLCLHEDHCEFTLCTAGWMAVVDLCKLECCQVVFTMGRFNR